MAKPAEFSDKLLGMGIMSAVVALDNHTALKHPLCEEYFNAVVTEKRIFERLGDHDCIVKYIRPQGNGLVLERLRYPLRKHLLNLQEDGGPPPHRDEILKWAMQILRGLQHLHSHSVYQFDIGCHNILLDFNNNVKLSDFSGSLIDDGKVEVAPETRSTHPCLINHWHMSLKPTVKMELFAVGTVLYEMSTIYKPYQDKGDSEVEKLYLKGLFPDTTGMLLGNIIQKCWTDKYHDTKEVIEDLLQIEPGLSDGTEVQGSKYPGNHTFISGLSTFIFLVSAALVAKQCMHPQVA
ncbi:serine/threonine protein kinase [Trichophyton rubrum D6]|uniref:Serine/threonine protein kinase n=4 Tax=Trichophyton TaxID=5550 RepID=A0A178F227_TRIRU|nr:serine/threonine protein kinase [Trichophyton rubrum CBS 118892]EZF13164.1 serine/threonine protein kinase [Trichophyton rubrum MR850]EZF39694.1 serine/threonine protein kinase [Trichophyton rubrum CBS 100081]EZF50218.1 serine/threonine protein kinase [Trichophyton rubrum CBS 288.86]EZF60850.1 serine/threonine protein kinase [Trichophyton rubrum CBS 289.86]EZF71368.1 serine/threonine protein kinase [Trichophyton soudanense CBS 452.61]EZF82177.1 serine/threonine protein kinase [Trichophyton